MQQPNAVESFLPHRDRMKLVDEILAVDGQTAATRCTVSARWPFFDGQSVSSLVLVELVAQTAGICNSWAGKQKQGEKFQPRGWLVGIKQAHFFKAILGLGSHVIVRTENGFKFESYREVMGTAEIDGQPLATVDLQLMQSDPEETGESR